MFDEYVRWEVIPFIHHHCRGLLPIATMGASLGAYHAANTLFKHPDAVKRCWAMSGLYDMRGFMDGLADDNFYFNNPIDYLGGLHDPGMIGLLNTCDIHVITGTGPWEKPEHSYHLSHLLALKGVRHHLDDWGPEGGHDWPYWKHQMWTYLQRV
jgi:esterase/lipase superfamily enzyme